LNLSRKSVNLKSLNPMALMRAVRVPVVSVL
jgi:hypothetical protein